MATIEKRTSKDGDVTYRAKIRLKGSAPASATFQRRTDAKKWIQDTESAIRNGRYFKTRESKKRTLTEAINRYTETIIPLKQERVAVDRKLQLAWWKNQLGHLLLADVTPSIISEKRDRNFS